MSVQKNKKYDSTVTVSHLSGDGDFLNKYLFFKLHDDFFYHHLSSKRMNISLKPLIFIRRRSERFPFTDHADGNKMVCGNNSYIHE